MIDVAEDQGRPDRPRCRHSWFREMRVNSACTSTLLKRDIFRCGSDTTRTQGPSGLEGRPQRCCRQVRESLCRCPRECNSRGEEHFLQRSSRSQSSHAFTLSEHSGHLHRARSHRSTYLELSLVGPRRDGTSHTRRCAFRPHGTGSWTPRRTATA